MIERQPVMVYQCAGPVSCGLHLLCCCGGERVAESAGALTDPALKADNVLHADLASMGSLRFSPVCRHGARLP